MSTVRYSRALSSLNWVLISPSGCRLNSTRSMPASNPWLVIYPFLSAAMGMSFPNPRSDGRVFRRWTALPYLARSNVRVNSIGSGF